MKHMHVVSRPEPATLRILPVIFDEAGPGWKDFNEVGDFVRLFSDPFLAFQGVLKSD